MEDRVLFVLIPAYNEGEKIEPFLASLTSLLDRENWPWHLVVVDDGSTDGTGAILDRLCAGDRFSLLRHDTNRGVGQAFSTGFAHVVEHGDANDILVVMEADGTNDMALLPEMIRRLDDCDVVIGSRMTAGGAMPGFPAHRRFFSNLGNLTMQWMFRYPGVTDYTIFYRAYRIAALREIEGLAGGSFFQEEGFAANCEILLRIACFGGTVCEIPLVYRYDLKDSSSKLRLAPTILGYFSLIKRFRRAVRSALTEGRCAV